MKFAADEIASVIQAELEEFENQIDVREVGGERPLVWTIRCRIAYDTSANRGPWPPARTRPDKEDRQ